MMGNAASDEDTDERIAAVCLQPKAVKKAAGNHSGKLSLRKSVTFPASQTFPLNHPRLWGVSAEPLWVRAGGLSTRG